MTRGDEHPPRAPGKSGTAGESRQTREARALRENLRKRKSQARQRESPPVATGQATQRVGDKRRVKDTGEGNS